MPHYLVQTNSQNQVETIDYQPIGANTGLKAELDKAITTVMDALHGQGVYFESYIDRITNVYVSPEPTGFDFKCKNASSLLALVRNRPTKFHLDSTVTVNGGIMAAVTRGIGFRQVSSGPALHIEIDVPSNWCNVHIDSHGFVDGGGYNCDRMLSHGVWDLATGYSLASWAYFSKGSFVFNPFWGNVTLNVPTAAIPVLGWGRAPELSTIPSVFSKYSPAIYAKIGPGGHFENGNFSADVGMSYLKLDLDKGASLDIDLRASVARRLGPLSGRIYYERSFTSNATELQGELKLEISDISADLKKDFLKEGFKATTNIKFTNFHIEASYADSNKVSLFLFYEM